jgi:hypothetical protein
VGWMTVGSDEQRVIIENKDYIQGQNETNVLDRATSKFYRVIEFSQHITLTFNHSRSKRSQIRTGNYYCSKPTMTIQPTLAQSINPA